jgi:hypothetical protein
MNQKEELIHCSVREDVAHGRDVSVGSVAFSLIAASLGEWHCNGGGCFMNPKYASLADD